MAKGRGDFTDVLLRKKIISADQLREALQLQQSTGAKLADALVKLGYVTPTEIMQAVAEYHSLQSVDLTEVTIPPSVIELVPESVARENVILPLAQEDGTLKVIMSDPMDMDTIQKLQFILNKDIQPVLAPREQIIEAINRYYGQSETESVDSMLQEFTDTAIDTTETESAAAAAAVLDSDAPVVKLVNLIIQEAVTLRASDIHIEPFAEHIRVRYRIDGVLVQRDSPPKRLLPAIISRIKIMGKMDIAEKRRPQDGRIKMVLNGKHYDLRVSILPTNHGQACVMRILDRQNVQISIRDLGFSEEDYQKFVQIIKRPNGIFLVTGPTGSGKTTTLYAVLNELNRPDRKIITAEDPVEYYLPGVNQVEVKHQIGLDFARIIRAMLRQAPNILLIGEIRDKETAEAAIQASLTGHLVFSTLHTNDAPSAITRMVDIGLQPFLIASSLIGVMAQRLVRLVCPKCREPDTPPASEIKAAGLTPERLKTATFYRGRGCQNCHHTGYRGRTGIFELMKMNATLRELTFKREPTQVIRRYARMFGMRTLLEDGVEKACRGLTTLEEVLSICHHESAYA
ncbi:MAG: ATPase, T2SS/T4P/T4SS family [Gemmatales bacterium]|nr:ATPase, T2SS/T4P/T4SS family [Gemmatales bacterium]MCS7159237.1 ATPase, T2SS/T4P/T4SS family [Gemmatales bacterium]MDW8174437.1 ATPase, T2SS/T4P/T4SS family [Gemmatales bacterium]MDW8222538.1 ATPase, T2SS/T4P/T4SS family [Gemmatales bacterium]